MIEDHNVGDDLIGIGATLMNVTGGIGSSEYFRFDESYLHNSDLGVLVVSWRVNLMTIFTYGGFIGS